MEDSDVYRLIWLSRPLMQRAEALVEQQLQGTGLTVRMRAVLEILRAKGDCSVPELANHLEIQRQYVQLMVNEVVAAGYASKKTNPRHKRSVLIYLTQQGSDLIEKVAEREAEVLAKLQARLQDEDVTHAVGVVEKVMVALSAEIEGANT